MTAFKYVTGVVIMFLAACSSNPLTFPPPPVVPGIPGQHWSLCLRLADRAVGEIVLSDPNLAAAVTEQELACIRMRAAAECGYVFERLASDESNSGMVLPGQWCPADFKESMERYIDSRCGDTPNEFVDSVMDEITSAMARRIRGALPSPGKGN